MTITLNNSLVAAVTLVVLLAAAAAKADDFGGQTDNDGLNASLDQQATSSQLSDPTARDSLRSHGHP